MNKEQKRERRKRGRDTEKQGRIEKAERRVAANLDKLGGGDRRPPPSSDHQYREKN